MVGPVYALLSAAPQVHRTDAFGAPLQTQVPYVTQPFQFTGEQRNPTGLIYLRARFYDPAIGRFMSRDPFAGVLRAPLPLNRYSYVLNNSMNAVDRNGLSSSKVTKQDNSCFNWTSPLACLIPDFWPGYGGTRSARGLPKTCAKAPYTAPSEMEEEAVAELFFIMVPTPSLLIQ